MKTKLILLAILTLTMGCVRESDNKYSITDEEISLHATIGDGNTKTILQSGGRVFWSPADIINVFYGDLSGKFTSNNTEPASTATFTGTLPSIKYDGKTEFVAVYPYSETTSISGNNTIDIVLPSEQTAVEGTFADDLFICVAKSKDCNLHFYNVCGGVKFSLDREDVKRIVFKGNGSEPLAGRLLVEFDTDGFPKVVGIAESSDSVMLEAPNGSTLKKGVWYFIVLAPQLLDKGYTMEFYGDELLTTETKEESVEVCRSAWGVLKDIGTPAPEEIHEAVDLGLPSGLKWATCNVGANAPEEYGDYFAWGETEPKSEYTWSNLMWCDYSAGLFSKYCTDSYYGTVDNNTILDYEDDAAAINWGGTWRMPTDAEWTELITECKWTWTAQNGVNGNRVSSKTNGNSIFLPAAGNRDETYLDGVGYRGEYWSSSLYKDEPFTAWFVHLSSSEPFRYKDARYYGYSVRAVTSESVQISIESITLDKTSLSMKVGESENLTATVLPANATDKNVAWTSGDTKVATVGANGKVTAVGAGATTITASAGGKTATCKVTVNGASTEHEWVDLGLPSGLKWASCNLGASAPEEYGDFFAWGETEPYYSSLDPLIWKEGKTAGYDWPAYQWCNGSYKTLTKYCTSSSYGTVDNKTLLDLEDDAATVNWGGTWRMPTLADCQELLDECTWTWTTQNGVNGRLVTGPNNNSIFLPAAGHRNVTSLFDAGSYGYYWSSSLGTDDPSCAWGVLFTSDYYGWNGLFRHDGRSVRAVSEKAQQ